MNELNFGVKYQKVRRILCVDKPCHPRPLGEPHIQCGDDEWALGEEIEARAALPPLSPTKL